MQWLSSNRVFIIFSVWRGILYNKDTLRFIRPLEPISCIMTQDTWQVKRKPCRQFMHHDPNVTWELSLTSESQPGLCHQDCHSSAKFWLEDLSKSLGLIFFLLSTLFFLPVVNSAVETEAAKSSSDANALQAPLNCDHTKFACLPSAQKPCLCSSKADLLNLQSPDPYSPAPLHGSLCEHRQWGQHQLPVSFWGQNALLSFNNNTSGNI